MVYRGKPSKACHECRRKRRKASFNLLFNAHTKADLVTHQCDLKLPACGQCQRSGTTCHGYRRDVDTLFLDHTGSTIPTAKVTKLVRAASSHHPEKALLATVYLPPILSEPAIEDFALAYFCRNNACSAAVTALLHTPSLSQQQAILVTSMKALGSATCAVEHNSTRMSLEASQYYSASLAAVKNALTSPTIAQCDDVLRAVMILCAFDTTSGTPLAVVHQSAHINGCAALLGARGVAQMESVQGRILFAQACVNVVSHCLTTCTRIPSILHDLTDSAVEYLDGERDQMLWIAHRVRLKITDLYSELSRNQMADMDKAVDDILSLDSELAIILERKSWNLHYNLCYPGQKIGDCPDTTWEIFQQQTSYHSICAYRIMLHLLVINLVRPNPDKDPDRAQRLKLSESIMFEHQDAILRNTPERIACAKALVKDDQRQIVAREFDVLSPPLGISHAEAAMANIAMAEKLCGCTVGFADQGGPGILRLSRGYGLIWQLMLVGVTSLPRSSLRIRTIELLRSIGQDLEIPQAVIMAERLGGK